MRVMQLSSWSQVSEAFPMTCLDILCSVVSRGAVCSNAYGGWFAPRARHSMRMTYRPSAALWLLGSLRISHNKFLRANKWILILPPSFNIAALYVQAFLPPSLHVLYVNYSLYVAGLWRWASNVIAHFIIHTKQTRRAPIVHKCLHCLLHRHDNHDKTVVKLNKTGLQYKQTLLIEAGNWLTQKWWM